MPTTVRVIAINIEELVCKIKKIKAANIRKAIPPRS